ncbi:hypothetical protein [Ktedonospora formicarum]|uniref:DUF3291 domain-containing protein n=1 Tax=Ktedonospora formicarum TaxID=2778364 RepID=A0A8J3IF34_9CHLR|nr:hypothetical protein [Ktedonospora formicarum]GHO50049.1 hypothetical protein KSX_82120 [Ktedonospora formicarum]
MEHMKDTNEPVVTFSLIRYHKPGLRTLTYLGLDHWKMHRVPGVCFWRLMGVGRGKVFSPHADLQRSAIFSVWRSYADARRFEEESSLMKRV